MPSNFLQTLDLSVMIDSSNFCTGRQALDNEFRLVGEKNHDSLPGNKRCDRIELASVTRLLKSEKETHTMSFTKSKKSILFEFIYESIKK